MLQSTYLSNLKSLTPPTTKIWKAIQDVENLGFGVIRGHQGYKNGDIQQSAYEFLLAFHSNYVPILRRFWDIVRYWSKIDDLNLFQLYLAPLLGVTPVEFRQDLRHQKTRVPGLSYSIVCIMLFSHFSTVPDCDGRPDSQMDRHMTTASTALVQCRAGKTQNALLYISNSVPLVLWYCWVGDKKGIQPVENVL